MSDIQVLWVANTKFLPGMYDIPHVHDYFHFNYFLSGTIIDINKKALTGPFIDCGVPGVMHAGHYAETEVPGINFMFITENNRLAREISEFPFRRIPPSKMHVDLLYSLVDQVRRLTPNEDMINNGISYYLRLLMAENADLVVKDRQRQLADMCDEYIEAHYAEPVELDDIAKYINRSRTYTSTLYSTATGISLNEKLNRVRVRNACKLVAYGNDTLESILVKCGYNSMRHFLRVFKQYVGTNPGKYRSSQRAAALRYDGGEEKLNSLSYGEDETFFTYAVYAGKLVEWKSPAEYLHQHPEL